MKMISGRFNGSVKESLSSRFHSMRALLRCTTVVQASAIHGRGLFALRGLEAGEMVIEYCGELIRPVLTDAREKLYEAKNIGCYMFKIDELNVVDATMKGNSARFINHSCEPNCYSRVCQIEGRKRIIICTSRYIRRGEELTYNYKFPIEENKIICRCQSKKCKGYMN
ncbi:hypothetical protein HELRODRAFT_98024 [Helobdella robusta]|uniref:[histone H3]-lysine(4) N-trimethyltransferase n=1 Tax=Helobdella robusta TaxID=6412 RepID=T1G9K0_HELRO|nr:hypothetical protein HELRODRAFT_98024 [Helobdella robusta]ESO08569.1 hypothetical protein HELRODRAFT_98024 [Helobdella robusta]